MTGSGAVVGSVNRLVRLSRGTLTLDASSECARLLDTLAELAPLFDLVGDLLRKDPHNEYLNVLANNVIQELNKVRIELEALEIPRAQEASGRCEETQPGLKLKSLAVASQGEVFLLPRPPKAKRGICT